MCHPGKRRAEKNMAVGPIFQKLRGELTIRGATFSRATMFFCKRVISVAILLLIIHITMYILK